MSDSAFYDAAEIRSPEEREAALFAALPGHLAHVRHAAPAYGDILRDWDPRHVSSRAALAALPITRKSQHIERQKSAPPFGGLVAIAADEVARIYCSPGPIYEPEGFRRDYWGAARALYAASFRRGELVHNAFAYHFTPAGTIFETGAHALGCPVFPAGTGQTEMQMAAIADLRPSCYVGTPSFLKRILDRGREKQLDLSSLSKALVSAEALPPSLRAAISAYGVAVLQCYATADLGVVAYESEAREGLILNEELILEIVRPGTGDPLPEGEVGEVVITTLNPDYPLIRFGTGDLSAVLPGISPCGRTNIRIRGWMGRADQATKVRGLFVHPEQIAQLLQRHPEILKARLVVEQEQGADAMTLRCEVAPGAQEGLIEAIAAAVRQYCKVRGEVELVVPGTLPNDGKVIDDLRRYE
jgi:phenylacetate-CoA ligase